MTAPRETSPELTATSRVTTHGRGIGLLLLAFVALAFTFSVVNPLHEATDELRHYRFVRIVATTGRLPVQGEGACRAQAHHPPLFYAAGALLTAWIDTGRDICYQPPTNPFWAYRYWEVGSDNKNQYLHDSSEAFPWRGEALAAHIVRALNVLLGAVVVFLTWATARLLWPDRAWPALGAAALVAFNPMFLYMSGSINNDIIAALSGAAVVYAAARLLHEPHGLNWRWGVAFGALYGLALMSKFNLAAIVAVIEVAMTWIAWRRGQWRQWLVANALMAAVAALIAGWWFVRNQLLYGEPTGFEAVTELWGVRDPRQSFGLALSELPYAWSTLWGRFGYGQIPLPQIIYDGLLWVTVIGLLGAGYGLLARESTQRRVVLSLLALNILIFFAVLFNYMLVSPAGPNGRFFFPALSSLALLIFYGLDQWLALIAGAASALADKQPPPAIGPVRTQQTLSQLTALSMLALALVALIGYLAPAYAAAPRLPAGAPIPNRVDVRFDNLVTLLGYEVEAQTLAVGEGLDVRLYWEVTAKPPGNYLLFLHMLDGARTMAAQRDTHPGLGNFPTGQWEPGDRFVDAIRIYVPETAYAPETLTLYMGLYDPVGYRLAVSSSEGKPLGDAVNLGQVSLLPMAGPYPNAQDYTFTNGLRFVGYRYDGRQVRAGNDLPVDLFWDLSSDPPPHTVIQVRLLDQQGQQASSSDSRPAAAWLDSPGPDRHRLAIPGELPPGRYDVELSVVNESSGEREFLVAEDGHYIDSRLLLAQVQVLP
jgi:4-amino-4-deoxy-L-arabinose transferase-like glycosyltransferase